MKLLKAGIGFFTTIPVGISMEELELLSHHIYLFPLFGLVIGIIVGGFGYLLLSLPLVISQIIALLLIVLLYLLSGVNHLDGLADFGDGVVAHGTKEEKIAIMRDPKLGTGGALFCILAILALFSALWAIADLRQPLLMFKLFVTAEIAAKLSMITLIVLGKGIHKGFGSMMIEHASKRDFAVALVFSAAIAYLALGIAGVAVILASIISALLVLRIANRNFGGISGDVMGASNEIGRIFALVTGVIAVIVCMR